MENHSGKFYICEITQGIEALKEERKDLAERVATLQFNEILTHLDYHMEFNRDKELYRLLSLYSASLKAHNTAMVIYGNNPA